MQALSDGLIKWEPFSREEKICERFPLDVWHQIVHDVDSDEEWDNFLEKSQFVKCYILRQCSNNESIAFIYNHTVLATKLLTDEVFMWINEKKLKGTKLYKRFYMK